jgi:hypothetical protein
MKKFTLPPLAAILLCSACAGVAAPRERFANSQGELRAAEAVGADKIPKAALHLQLAREEIAQAKAQMDAGDNERADYTLRRAHADAALATALAQSEPLQERAAAAKKELEKIKPQTSQSAQ